MDAAVRHVLWYGVTCHPADAADETMSMSELCMQQSVVYSVVPRAADVDGPLNTVCQYQVRRQEMKWAMFLYQVENGGVVF